MLAEVNHLEDANVAGCDEELTTFDRGEVLFTA
jgi:hypothetical protein